MPKKRKKGLIHRARTIRMRVVTENIILLLLRLTFSVAQS